MAKKIAVQMKNRIFSDEHLTSIVAFLQEFRSAWVACEIHNGAVMWMFKNVLTDLAETAVKV